MSDERIALILSMLGMIATVASFQAKKKLTLLLLQSIGTGFYLTSYIFANGGIAVGLNAIYLARNFLFMKQWDKKSASRICGALCVSYAVVYAVFLCISQTATVEKAWNALPVIGALFGTVALKNTNLNKLRFQKYGDSICWLAFNIRLGLAALGGIIGEILNLISLTLGIIRYRKDKKARSSLKSSERPSETF